MLISLEALSRALRKEAGTKLRKLGIYGSFTDRGLTALARALLDGSCPLLQELSVGSREMISSESLASLSAVLAGGAEYSRSLTHLYLEEIGLSAGHMQALVEALRSPTGARLKESNIRWHSIDDKRLTCLVRTLRGEAGSQLTGLRLIEASQAGLDTITEAVAEEDFPRLLLLKVYGGEIGKIC